MDLRPLFEAIERYFAAVDRFLELDDQPSESVDVDAEVQRFEEAQWAVDKEMEALVPTDEDGDWPWEKERKVA